jgi:hypothetical protein
MYLTQMVNTRRGGGIDLPPNRHTRWIYRQPQPQPAEMNPPNPPPGGVRDGNGYKPAGFCYPKLVPVKNIYTR